MTDPIDQHFTITSGATVRLTDAITNLWIKVGRPNTIDTQASWTVVDAIMATWIHTFPQEYAQFMEEVRDERELERSPHQAVKANGGYFPIMYPPKLLLMLKTFFPDQKLQDKKFIKEFINQYPFLKATKYNI